MWVDETLEVKDDFATHAGRRLRPLFMWIVTHVVRPRDDSWTYNMIVWSLHPLLIVQKPRWFGRFIMTLCGTYKNESSKS